MKIGIYIVSFILTALILINSMQASFAYAYYNIDPVGFIEALCENQDTPELQCNGKCHLKKIAKSQEKGESESIISFKEIILFFPKLEASVFYKIDYIKKKNLTVHQNLYSFNSINDCYHPPQV